MKRILSCISLTLCVILGTVFIAACSSGTKYIRPYFFFDETGFNVDLKDNVEEDFVFPIEGVKLDHSNFERERLLEYRWVIYNADDELVGWIEGGNGYDYNKDGSYVYGYSSSYFNEVYGFYSTYFTVTLKSKDLTIFDRLEITSDYGKVEKVKGDVSNPVRATERYNEYNSETGETKPFKGAENFVVCNYEIVFDDIAAPGIEEINITLKLKAE